MSPTLSHFLQLSDTVVSDVSRNSEISIQSYLRTDEPKRGSDGVDDMGNDIFMGGITFTPDFDNMGTQDQWYDLNGGAGKLMIGVAFQPSSVGSSSTSPSPCSSIRL